MYGWYVQFVLLFIASRKGSLFMKKYYCTMIVSATQVPAHLRRPLQLGHVGANEPLSPTTNTLATNGPERCQPVNRRLYREDCEERGTHEHYCNKLFLPLFYEEAVLVASSPIPLASSICFLPLNSTSATSGI